MTLGNLRQNWLLLARFLNLNVPFVGCGNLPRSKPENLGGRRLRVPSDVEVIYLAHTEGKKNGRVLFFHQKWPKLKGSAGGCGNPQVEHLGKVNPLRAGAAPNRHYFFKTFKFSP
jgi:hypothetical protein